MRNRWTLGQKTAAAFAATVILVVIVAAVGLMTTRAVLDGEREVQRHHEAMMELERLRARMHEEAAAFRGLLLTGDNRYLDRLRGAQDELSGTRRRLAELVETAEGEALLADLVAANAAWIEEVEAIVLQVDDANMQQMERLFEREAVPRFERLLAAVDRFIEHKEERSEETRSSSQTMAERSGVILTVFPGIAAVLAALLGFWLVRNVSGQVSEAVGDVQSSSAELEVASKQQATTAREQAAAVAEVTSTLKELLATSRQISESSRKVADLAERAATAANDGGSKVAKLESSMNAIDRQVDAVVDHMLDLGKKSQQAGGILDIINELAEQTNILAINATIEAVGAGEAGRRFTVVADEIRRLADRVSESSRDIRVLIDDMRAASSTTVMATEEGAKSVAAGAEQFTEMTATFSRIVELVGITTEASQEIELSTKQQTSAVEQVNTALNDVAQAAREGEVAAKQSQEMASQLARLSRDLTALVKHEHERETTV